MTRGIITAKALIVFLTIVSKTSSFTTKSLPCCCKTRVAFSKFVSPEHHDAIHAHTSPSSLTTLRMSYKIDNNRRDTSYDSAAASKIVLKTALVNDSDLTLDATANRSIEPNDSRFPGGIQGFLDSVFERSFWAPRIFLAAIACLYGTNFALGSIMDDALPASAATCDRMVLAALALSPFIFQLKPELRGMTLLAGLCTATGYVTQSLALVDTTPATVSFLGAAIVLVCPALQALVDKKPMGWKDAPQTWIAAALCIMGVGFLELWNPNGGASALDMGISMGHALAMCQAVGFGAGIFLSSKAMTRYPDQALPVTSVMVAMTALVSMLWSIADGWMFQLDWQSMALPQVLFDNGDGGAAAVVGLSTVGAAVLWTGLISTSLNFFLENFALGHVPSAEASVILATEPLWAALFASVLVGEGLGWNDSLGGLLIVSACLANTATPEQVHGVLARVTGSKDWDYKVDKSLHLNRDGD